MVLCFLGMQLDNTFSARTPHLGCLLLLLCCGLLPRMLHWCSHLLGQEFIWNIRSQIHLRQEPQAVLFVQLVHNDEGLPTSFLLQLVGGMKKWPQNHGRVSSDKLLWPALQPHSANHALVFSPLGHAKEDCSVQYYSVQSRTPPYGIMDPIRRIGRVFVENNCSGKYCEILD